MIAQADLHFAIESLSPLKLGRSGAPYFHGSVTDGTTKKMRLVGFDQKLQEQMASLTDLENCQIKRGRNNKYEIFLGNTTKVLPSQRKIEFPASSVLPMYLMLLRLEILVHSMMVLSLMLQVL